MHLVSKHILYKESDPHRRDGYGYHTHEPKPIFNDFTMHKDICDPLHHTLHVEVPDKQLLNDKYPRLTHPHLTHLH